ncbi:hypothetical protein, partial [Klebsiella pneumoniae]|uniref:hypothetical protein n=1 Tax=Klebsiella pneumoniae TaxID=573 RepID=UPI001C6E818E
LVVLVGLAIDQIAQSGLSSLSVIYYSAQLFSSGLARRKTQQGNHGLTQFDGESGCRKAKTHHLERSRSGR